MYSTYHHLQTKVSDCCMSHLAVKSLCACAAEMYKAYNINRHFVHKEALAQGIQCYTWHAVLHVTADVLCPKQGTD